MPFKPGNIVRNIKTQEVFEVIYCTPTSVLVQPIKPPPASKNAPAMILAPQQLELIIDEAGEAFNVLFKDEGDGETN